MRTTEDALRSVKKFLAVALGTGRTPLGAVRRLRYPSEDLLDQAALEGSYGVWTGLDDADDPAEALLDVADDADGLIRLPLLAGGRKWFVTPPLTRRASDGSLSPAATTEDSYSPGLVAGCVEAEPQSWSVLLGLDRYGFDLAAEVGGRAYRVRPVSVDPLVAAATAGWPLDPAELVALDALADPDDWDVRFFGDRGEVEYPVCIVKPVGPTRPIAGARFTELTQSLTIYCYPRPAPTAVGNASTAALATERVRDLLIDAFAVGTLGGGRPMRIPLYDYDGADSLIGSSQREPFDYLRVVDASVDATVEPGDETKQVVVADVRVNWTRGVGERRGAGTVDEVFVRTELT